MKSLDETQTRNLINIAALHEALDQIHKDVAEASPIRRTRKEKVLNTCINVLLLSINVGDYIMTRSHTRKEHKLQTKWHGPMRENEAKWISVFNVNGVVNARQLTVPAQRMVPYPAPKQNACTSDGLRQQGAHFDTSYHLVNEIRYVRKQKGVFEVITRWTAFEDNEYVTREALKNIRKRLPGILGDFLYTPGEPNWKRKILQLYF